MPHATEVMPYLEIALWITPPKINIEPENDGLEDDFPLPGVFSLRFHVNLPGCISFIKKNIILILLSSITSCKLVRLCSKMDWMRTLLATSFSGFLIIPNICRCFFSFLWCCRLLWFSRCQFFTPATRPFRRVVPRPWRKLWWNIRDVRQDMKRNGEKLWNASTKGCCKRVVDVSLEMSGFEEIE